MSTPDPGAPIAVEDLARMANEFFLAIPGVADAIGQAQPDVGIGVPLTGPSVPSSAARRMPLAYVGDLAQPDAIAPDAGYTQPLASGVPGVDAAPETASWPDTATLPGVPAPAVAPGTLTQSDSPVPVPSATALDQIPQGLSGVLDFSPSIPFGAVAVGGQPPAHPWSAGPSLEVWDPFAFSPDLEPHATGLRVPAGAFDAESLRADFPILRQRVHGKRLVWLDNGATTQKPQAVIDRLSYFYEHENSNIHRAAHTLAARATDAYEKARSTVADFINADDSDRIVFVRGATEGVNLIAGSWGERHIGEGDEVLISHLEHHANIVPWQQLCLRKGAKLVVAPVDDTGQIIVSEFERLLNRRTRLVAVTAVSNALGTVTPIEELTAAAHRHGAKVLVDAAQSIPHMRVDVAQIGCDFLVFSGHKVFGPTGIGVVYGTAEAWEETPPWQFGGNMIADVTFERSIFQPPPGKFEAGTGNIADAVGLGTALEYVSNVGIERITLHEHALLEYATSCLRPIPGLRIIGTASAKAGVLSFVLKDIPPHEVGSALDKEGIAVRAGHHCAQPILRRFGVEATVRPSFALYNTFEDVDLLASAVRRIAAGQPAGI